MNHNFTKYLIISGPDAYKFLQTQITADLDLLNEKDLLLSSYCNRQGRVVSVFYVIKTKDNNQEQYIFIFLGDTVDIFLNAIKKYSVFSKVNYSEISDINELITSGITTDIIDINKFKHALTIDYCIDNLIPVIDQNSSGKYLPNELNLIPHSAVSFKKGCFLGQEVIARVFYKGKTKKTLMVKRNSDIDDKSSDNVLMNNDELSLVISSI